MRLIALAALLAVACSPSPPPAAQAPHASGGFPDLSAASYRAEATISDDSGRSMPTVMIRSGDKLRMEIATPEGNVVVITNAADRQGIVLTNAGGRQVAMRVSGGDQFKDPAADWSGDLAANAVRGGACSAAGETGTEWTRSDSAETACISADGIILRAGAAGKPQWEATKVERGPQDPSLFEVPAGVDVLDLNNVGGMVDALRRSEGN
jgi:hypothetical protein